MNYAKLKASIQVKQYYLLIMELGNSVLKKS